MSYGLSDVTDERKVQAIEAQAADIDKVAATLEASQPAAALALRTQAMGMRQQSAAFRMTAGLPPAGTWTLRAKVGLLFGLTALAAGAYWLGRSKN